MKILFLSDWYPWPPNNGSKLRIYNLLRGLSKNHELTLVSFSDQFDQAPKNGNLVSVCRKVEIVPKNSFNPKSLKARKGFLSLTPRSFIDTYSMAMSRKIQEVISDRKPDLIIASQIGTAVYHADFSGIPALFEEVEIGLLYEKFLRAKSTLELIRNGLTWWKHRLFLSKVLQRFQACTVVSENEKELLGKLLPEFRVEVIPNCIELSNYQEVKENPEPYTLIFTGSFNYYPNYEAMTWFLEKVYPQIITQIPEIRLVITGDSGGRKLPDGRNIIQTGFIEDIRPLIARSWISIVPILSGGGTRLKILEAMALNTPVVTTRKGAEGLQVEHDSNILFADTPNDFAQNTIRLLREPDTRLKLASNAFQLIKSKYEWSVIHPRFNHLVETLIV